MCYKQQSVWLFVGWPCRFVTEKKNCAEDSYVRRLVRSPSEFSCMRQQVTKFEGHWYNETCTANGSLCFSSMLGKKFCRIATTDFAYSEPRNAVQKGFFSNHFVLKEFIRYFTVFRNFRFNIFDEPVLREVRLNIKCHVIFDSRHIRVILLAVDSVASTSAWNCSQCIIPLPFSRAREARLT